MGELFDLEPFSSIHINSKIGEKLMSEFDCGMIVSGRQSCLCISETAEFTWNGAKEKKTISRWENLFARN